MSLLDKLADLYDGLVTGDGIETIDVDGIGEEWIDQEDDADSD